MWPFHKKTRPESQMMPPGQISYTQLDITETFGDNERLKPDDWVPTQPLSQMTPSSSPPANPIAGRDAFHGVPILSTTPTSQQCEWFRLDRAPFSAASFFQPLTSMRDEGHLNNERRTTNGSLNNC